MRVFSCALLIVLTSFFCGAEPVKKPLAFYLKNLPMERVGGLSDAQIKNQLRQDGFIVIDVDCSSFPRTSPQLEDALVHFHKDCAKVYSKYEDSSQSVDVTNIFYVPAGYTVTRNVPVWNILEHSADGSMEWVMDTWNNHIVARYGEQKATSPEQMKNPDSSPLDLNLYIDIVHPSGRASRSVPLLLTFGSITPRMASFRPDRPIGRVYRSIFPFGFLTSGYAFAVTDHCYNPLVPKWGHFKQYTLDDYNAHASSTAFIRYLRAHADQYNLNGKIGVMGISKASYSSVRVADRSNSEGGESLLFGGRVNEKPQPWAEADSHVDVAYAAAGIGAERAFRYVENTSVPLITSAGMSDEYNQWPVYPDVVRYLSSIDHIHLSFWMEDLGHTFPCMGEDSATGISRYVLFKKFFDHYLKKPSGDVMYVLPKEGAADVDPLGKTRVLPQEKNMPGMLPKHMLPSAMGYFIQSYPYASSYAGMVMRVATGEQKYILFREFYERYIAHPGNFSVLAADKIFPSSLPSLEARSPITVRFFAEYSLDQIRDNVVVSEDGSGNVLDGVWISSMKGTCFSFYPNQPLKEGESYRISVPTAISSISGERPSAAVTRTFIVSNHQ